VPGVIVAGVVLPGLLVIRVVPGVIMLVMRIRQLSV